MKLTGMGDVAIVAELGRRLQRARLNRNVTQGDLAARAGVSRGALQHCESGSGCTVDTLVKLLRALGRLDAVDAFLPEPGPSPLQLAKLQGRERRVLRRY